MDGPQLACSSRVIDTRISSLGTDILSRNQWGAKKLLPRSGTGVMVGDAYHNTVWLHKSFFHWRLEHIPQPAPQTSVIQSNKLSNWEDDFNFICLFLACATRVLSKAMIGSTLLPAESEKGARITVEAQLKSCTVPSIISFVSDIKSYKSEGFSHSIK